MNRYVASQPDVHQSLKNAEEELARHCAVIDQRKAWDREVIEGVRSGRYQVESGDGRRVDQGRNSDNSQDNVPPWLARQRDDALRTVDRYTPQRIQTLTVAIRAR